jgi:hypothetical protein
VRSWSKAAVPRSAARQAWAASRLAAANRSLTILNPNFAPNRLTAVETKNLRIAQTLETNAEMKTLRKLRKSVEEAGGFRYDLPFDDQIHVFRHEGVDYLVNGHHRLAVAEKLGIKELKAIYLTEAELLEYGVSPAELVKLSQEAIQKGNRIRWR